jgi:outer membrane lipoprotein-sorting protein
VSTEPRFRSIKAELRRQLMPAVSLRVLERWAATRPKGSVWIATFGDSSSDGRGSTEPAEEEVTVQSSRLWVDAPSRWRYEVEMPDGRTAMFVSDGPLWWSFAPSLHAHSNESAPDRYPGQREHQERHLFYPEEILAGLIVTSTRLDEREGRPVEVIEAVARGDYAPFSLPSGADSYHLVIDRERGVALRIAARTDGLEFLTVEITSLEFDAPMDHSLFRIELPAGVAFTPPPSHVPRPTLLRRVLGRLHLGPRY